MKFNIMELIEKDNSKISICDIQFLKGYALCVSHDIERLNKNLKKELETSKSLYKYEDKDFGEGIIVTLESIIDELNKIEKVGKDE